MAGKIIIVAMEAVAPANREAWKAALALTMTAFAPATLTSTLIDSAIHPGIDANPIAKTL